MSFLCPELRHEFRVHDFNSAWHGCLSVGKQVKSGGQTKARIIPSGRFLEAVLICQYQWRNPCFPDVPAHKLTESVELVPKCLVRLHIQPDSTDIELLVAPKGYWMRGTVATNVDLGGTVATNVDLDRLRSLAEQGHICWSMKEVEVAGVAIGSDRQMK